VGVWFDILSPARTPLPVIAKLNAAVREVLSRPDIQQKFLGYGCVATASSPQEFEAIIVAEVPKWTDLIQAGRVTSQ
jgi:tripartite-type tricarboxylate transporter receptor subunit TctC